MFQEMLAVPEITPVHRVREDRDFYIPDYLSGGSASTRSGAWSAADQQASDLRDAERYLADALNLVAVLRASLEHEGDTRAVQAETVLKIVQGRLKKVHRCMDRHDTRFMNLFLAYADLRELTEPSGDA